MLGHMYIYLFTHRDVLLFLYVMHALKALFVFGGGVILFETSCTITGTITYVDCK